MIVGHPKVTKRAYEQDSDARREAAQFALAAIHNGLGENSKYLPAKAVTQLIAQVERDYLVSIMPPQSPQASDEPSHDRAQGE